MKFKKCIFMLLIITISVMLINFVYINPLIYNSNYYEDIGIKGAHLYDNVVKLLGEPLSIDVNTNMGVVTYRDLEILYPLNKNNKISGAFLSVFITGEKYKFGIRKIKVGSTKQQVENAYGGVIQKITDLPKDEIGFIDGSVWVVFYLDKNDVVYKINISNGP